MYTNIMFVGIITIQNNNKKDILMTSIVFDSLEYTNKLKAVGVPVAQAEVHAKTMAHLIDEKLATKRDLEILGYQLTIRFGWMLFAAVTVLVVLIKL
jgi:hypothetical protein